MKKIVMIGLVILLATLVSGCAAKIGGTSVKHSDDDSAVIIQKMLAAQKTIYYKIVPCEAGWLNWSVVKEPIENPDAITIEFGQSFADETVRLFKEQGFNLVEIGKSAGNDSLKAQPIIFMEIRVAVNSARDKMLFMVPVREQPSIIGAGSRWFVFVCKGKECDKKLELYDFQVRSLPSAFLQQKTETEQFVIPLASRMINAFLVTE